MVFNGQEEDVLSIIAEFVETLSEARENGPGR